MTTKPEAEHAETFLSVLVPIDIAVQRIADLMIGAIEGGSTQWCLRIEHRFPPGTRFSEKPWYASPEIYDREDFSLNVHVDDEDEPLHVITKNSLMGGFTTMARKYGNHFRDFMEEGEDAVTADVWFQCVVLGDVVYR